MDEARAVMEELRGRGTGRACHAYSAKALESPRASPNSPASASRAPRRFTRAGRAKKAAPVTPLNWRNVCPYGGENRRLIRLETTPRSITRCS
ncbi:hypothetical protein SKAU_G00070400 [Synaphobranchus kaupii]|uniref:Uncharacterized protein n=1 Tax=Synaphobranchus kaupii TaxID=118154 RepID=A0A9Q1G880_SYNKA|nr:hypothetical protein SKAU_G00070400 [Synaphobranchus kaupii]